MTDVIDAPGIGHNQPDPMEMEKKHQKWDRWAKKRTFVRALEGTYSHLYKTLVDEKRVYSAERRGLEGRPADVRQERHQPAGDADHPVDRIPHRGLCAEDRRTEARPPQQRGVLRAQGPRLRHPRRQGDSVEGRRRDAGRERLRAPALQRFRDRGVHPPRVQGEAAVPVHAPAAAEDGGVAARAGSGSWVRTRRPPISKKARSTKHP